MEHRIDYLVIGSGAAGLSFALKAAAHGSVAIVSKREAHASNTWYAQGGIASVWSTQDRFDLHVDDTLIAGDGLCHRDVVELVVRGGLQGEGKPGGAAADDEIVQAVLHREAILR